MMTIGAKTMSARTRGSNPSEVLCGGLTSARECHVPRKRKTKVKSLARSNLVLHHKDCQIRVSLDYDWTNMQTNCRYMIMKHQRHTTPTNEMI